ncbi:hypothetical protein [Leifsonia sp. AG29]|uniref:hypothetical protein n=1 Tax=Leifsonia sp. AG29 TaxID=2598860 RepID=UPI00131ABB4C|nr:hypothetical protein [Leifsonia sp. AG29]
MLLALTTSIPATAQEDGLALPLIPPSAQATTASLVQMDEEVRDWRRLAQPATEALLGWVAEAGVKPSAGLSLDTGGAVAWRVSEDVRLLRLPVALGQGVLSQSSLTVMFANDDTVVGSSEWVFTPHSANSGRVQSWLNGSLVIDQTVSAPDSDAPRITSMAYKKGDWWGNFNQCLSNAGVAAWVITGISIACAAVCVVTAGIGCIACLGAASAGFSGTVSYCITTANLYS